MAYALGIDVGTTFTAAAIMRDGQVEVVPLAVNQVAVPSLVYADRSDIVFGAVAERRGTTNPFGLAREFKRRVGDSVPLILSGAPYHADRLTALMTKWVTDTVVEQTGSEPVRIVLTHPANWTEYQLGTLRNALADVGHQATRLMSEPQAAATDFAAVANVAEQSCVLVYDLGGGTFDVALLQRSQGTFSSRVEPVGIERLGGIDFDEAVVQFAFAAIPSNVLEAARRTPEGGAALAQLRRRCVEAKEALSSDATSEIPVVLPDYTASIRITRAEFEEMIRPSIRQTIDLVRHTLERAALEPSELQAILLVGGSSRIPFVSQMVSEQLGLPVRVDAHPKLVTARGAARAAASLPPPKPVVVPGPAGTPHRRRRGPLLAGLAAIGVAAAATGIVLAAREDRPTTAATTTATSPTTASSITGSPATTTGGSGATTSTTDAAAFTPYAPIAEIATLAQPIDLEVIGNDLWVMSEDAGALERFDISTPDAPSVETIELGFTGDDGRNGNDIINRDGILFVTQKDAGTVARIDTNVEPRTVERIDVPGKPLNGTAIGSTIWITCQPSDNTTDPAAAVRALVPIDAATGTVGTSIPMPEVPYAIVGADNAAWVTFDEAGKIGRVDLTSGHVDTVSFISATDEPNDLLPLGAELFVTLGQRDQIAVVDMATLRVRRYGEVGFTPFKLIAGMGSIWVSNAGNGTAPGSVSRLEPTSRDLRRLQPPIELQFGTLELATGGDRIYVANYGSNTISVLAPTGDATASSDPAGTLVDTTAR